MTKVLVTKNELKKMIEQTALPSRAIAVYKLFVDMMDKDRCCFPSIKYIAKALHLSVATVKRALSDLKDKFIKIIARIAKDTNTQSSNLYQVLSLEEQRMDEHEGRLCKESSKDLADEFTITKLEEIEKKQKSVQCNDNRVYHLYSENSESFDNPIVVSGNNTSKQETKLKWNKFLSKAKSAIKSAFSCLLTAKSEPQGVHDELLIDKLIVNSNIGKRSSYCINNIYDSNTNMELMANSIEQMNDLHFSFFNFRYYVSYDRYML